MSHHKFAPSSLERLLVCPASYKLSQGIESKDSEYSIKGTQLHKAVETMDYLGLTFSEKEMVQSCVDYYSSFNTAIDIKFEQKLEVKHPDTNEVLTYGTADCIIETEEDIIIIDWKFGYNKVYSTNMQMKAYALALHQLNPNKPITTIIYQPAIYWIDKSVLFDGDHIQTMFDLMCIIDACENQNKEPNPSDLGCKYCPAKETCPALLGNIETAMEKLSSDCYDVTLLTDEILLDLMEQTKLVKDRIKQVEDEVKIRARENGSCGKYKLKSVKKLEVDSVDEARMQVVGLLSSNEFEECLSVSVPKIKTALKRVIIGNNKADVDKKVDDIIALFTTIKETESLYKSK